MSIIETHYGFTEVEQGIFVPDTKVNQYNEMVQSLEEVQLEEDHYDEDCEQLEDSNPDAWVDQALVDHYENQSHYEGDF